MTDQQQQIEERISDARGLFSAMFDEDAPDISDSLTRHSVKKRTDKGMKLLDKASDLLMEFGFKVEKMSDEIFELENELGSTSELAEALDFGSLADSLTYELEGRRLTETPEQVLDWIVLALRELKNPVDAEEIEQRTVRALRLVV